MKQTLELRGRTGECFSLPPGVNRGGRHDLVRLAEECLGIELSSVALAYFAIAARTPFAAFLYYRFVLQAGPKAVPTS